MKSVTQVLRDWEAVIGLEIHTALTSLQTKMFCDCRIGYDDKPNTHVCPVCLGMPGALPVPNEQAIQSIVMAGLATNCTISRRSYFYRKHYFYPDMPKNYQTTQGPVAFCMHGHMDLRVGPDPARERPDDTVSKGSDGSYVVPIRIQRIHMEEDAAKMVHVGGGEGRIGGATESLIDYNRSGMPLIELVTEPDLRTPAEARLFMEQLRTTFLALGISDCSLERGSMRCDGNVSIRRRGSKVLGTKTEVKNLNTFKGLHDALAYEICRQAEVLEGGGAVCQQTRQWEPSVRRTFVMRTKETADDYRMYPDPDLAPFDLSNDFVQRCLSRLPELPDAKRERYMREFGLKPTHAERIAGDPTLARLLDESVALSPGHATTIAHIVVNLTRAARDVRAWQVVCVAELLDKDVVASSQARDLLEVVSGTDANPEEVAEERHMCRAFDADALAQTVDAVLLRCTDQVRQYQEGNTKVIGYLIGQCMKATQGAGNPKVFGQMLKQRLRDAIRR